MNFRILLLVGLGGLGLTILCCGGKNLTRGKAAELIQQKFPPRKEWRIAPAIFQKGVLDELWTEEPLPGDRTTSYTLTDLGKQCIERVAEDPNRPRPAQGGFDWAQFAQNAMGQQQNTWGTVVLLRPVTLDVTVTGITSEPGVNNLKEAEFAWRLKGLPAPAEKLIHWVIDTDNSLLRLNDTKAYHGKALFRLYDDGWRLQEVTSVPYAPGEGNTFEITRHAPFPDLPAPAEATLRAAVEGIHELTKNGQSNFRGCGSAPKCAMKIPGFKPLRGVTLQVGYDMHGYLFAEASRAGSGTRYEYSEPSKDIKLYKGEVKPPRPPLPVDTATAPRDAAEAALRALVAAELQLAAEGKDYRDCCTGQSCQKNGFPETARCENQLPGFKLSDQTIYVAATTENDGESFSAMASQGDPDKWYEYTEWEGLKQRIRNAPAPGQG